ncbi:hypothetical protein BDQ12DRAFT_691470 [Crucibulum laeve]|uniref:RecQ-mediated genome instability protein 1 n=1 Tax=Crucibulum laeve TaxID=68775 RepID=A0A5C3LJB3_9AGAR|nr:hypothetical protein BDQ12DRAFT_691470 [Crucibulum laeve]
MIPSAVADWLEKNYPRPRIDEEWLKECYDWITTDQNLSPTTNLQGLLNALETQLLQSDLRDSMNHSTGLPEHVALPTTTTVVEGKPILVEITALTEVGSSAFQLDQIRVAREERMRTGGEEGEEDGDLEVEGEGPMPKYPRGMLRFELTDGKTTLQAMEYRMIKELTLGVTPLGYKMQLKNVRVRRGIAFLEPNNTILKGGKTVERDNNRDADFARGLRMRLGLPVDEVEDRENQAAPPTPPPPAPAPAPQPARAAPTPAPARQPNRTRVRSPLAEISPPPSPPPMYNDDEDLEPRRRKIPNHGGSIASSGSTLVGSAARSTTSSYFASGSGTTAASGSAPATRGPALDFSLLPASTRYNVPSLSPEMEDMEEFDFDLMDEIEQGAKKTQLSTGNKGKRKEAAPAPTTATSKTSPAKPVPKPKHRGQDSDDMFFGGDSMDMDDDEFLKEIEKAESSALARGPAQPPSSGSASGSGSATDPPSVSSHASASISNVMSRGRRDIFPPMPTPMKRPTPTPIDVIEIASDGDEEERGGEMEVEEVEAEDKENMPVPTRHVRRRLFGGSQSQTRSQGRGGGVMAVHAEEVIDISD